MFSATVITGMSMKCWCTMPMRLRDRVPWGLERHRLPADTNLALVGPVEAVQDVHERRLAGAVLSKERVYLAASDVEVDVVVGERPGELLGDPTKLEDGRVLHRVGILRGWGVAPPP